MPTSPQAAAIAGGNAGGGAGSALRSAAGPGYAGEWALFCDYTTATGQPTLPTTIAALTGFLTQIPAHGTTPARRIAAIAAAHRNTGHLLQRPSISTEPEDSKTRPQVNQRSPGHMIAACPTTGWPHGLFGRRDGFLIVLTGVLGYTHTQARSIRPAEISTSTNTNPQTSARAAAQVVGIRDHPLSTSGDPRTCVTCTVVRWLNILGILDGLGRGSARMHLHAATAPTAISPHEHAPLDPHRWRHTAHLLPAIDRHGWIDDYQPLSTRSIHTRLTLAAERASIPDPAPGEPEPATTSPPKGPRSRTPTLEEVLELLDQVADDADAVNHRIQALLAGDTPAPTHDGTNPTRWLD